MSFIRSSITFLSLLNTVQHVYADPVTIDLGPPSAYVTSTAVRIRKSKSIKEDISFSSCRQMIHPCPQEARYHFAKLQMAMLIFISVQI